MERGREKKTEGESGRGGKRHAEKDGERKEGRGEGERGEQERDRSREKVTERKKGK